MGAVWRHGCRESQDAITRGIVRDLQHYQKRREEIEKNIEILILEFHCMLTTIPGIDLVTAANMLAEIGNIERFPNATKLAEFAGVAPVNFSSAGKGKDV